jgi:hypothetical protein
MANYTFVTPTASEGPIGKHRLFYFRKMNKGITIVKSGSTYSQVRYPVDQDLATYTKVYRGGYNHTVNEATKAELIAGGVGITESNFTAQ